MKSSQSNNESKQVIKGGEVMSTGFMVTEKKYYKCQQYKNNLEKNGPKRWDVEKYNFTFKAENQLILPQTRYEL